MTNSGPFSIIYGFHAVEARLKHNKTSLKEVYIDQKFQKSNGRMTKRMQSFLDLLLHHQIKPMWVEEDYLDKICGDVAHQGIAAKVTRVNLACSIEELILSIREQGETPHLLLLDGVTDPHNLGACLRVADGAGIHAIIIPKQGSVSLNATVQKVSSGASEVVPIIEVANLSQAIEKLKSHDIWVIGTSDQAQSSIYEANLKNAIAWVMGAEGDGVRHLVKKNCDELLTIPMQGEVNSLNVSVASAVCAFETLRQRLIKK
jgi:23S rRNA (guanosine2251-2'-O)-methyltransferase